VENPIVNRCKLAVHAKAIGLGLSAREIRRLMESLSEVSAEINNSPELYKESNDPEINSMRNYERTRRRI